MNGKERLAFACREIDGALIFELCIDDRKQG
jgi:hypothetical protein